MSPNYGRGDLMAEEFTHRIFEAKTFGDLRKRNHRPFLIINATDMSRGSRFVFTQTQFDMLHSDLDAYPIGHAVAASAAVPGLFTPITLENYRSSSKALGHERKPAALEKREAQVFKFDLSKEDHSFFEQGRPYIHLIDGGVSDNLGLLPIVRIINILIKDDIQRRSLFGDQVKKIVIITVNAKRSPKKDWDNEKKSPGVSKTLHVASTAPMASFSQAQIEYLKLLLEKLKDKRKLREKLKGLLGEDFIDTKLKELSLPEIDCHFIEVAFNGVKDDQERAYLKELPTRFNLPREDIDRLRKAAVEILEQQPQFQSLLEELGPANAND